MTDKKFGTVTLPLVSDGYVTVSVMDIKTIQAIGGVTTIGTDNGSSFVVEKSVFEIMQAVIKAKYSYDPFDSPSVQVKNLHKIYSANGSVVERAMGADSSEPAKPYLFRGKLNDEELFKWLKELVNILGQEKIKNQEIKDITDEYNIKMASCKNAIKDAQSIISKSVYRKAQDPTHGPQ